MIAVAPTRNMPMMGRMGSADVARRLTDIVANIDRIFRYLGNSNVANFGADQRTVDAVERCLERICEAVVKIGSEHMADISPTLPTSNVRGLGNLLRHHYDRIDPANVFVTATRMLPALRRDCMLALPGQA